MWWSWQGRPRLSNTNKQHHKSGEVVAAEAIGPPPLLLHIPTSIPFQFPQLDRYRYPTHTAHCVLPIPLQFLRLDRYRHRAHHFTYLALLVPNPYPSAATHYSTLSAKAENATVSANFPLLYPVPYGSWNHSYRAYHIPLSESYQIQKSVTAPSSVGDSVDVIAPAKSDGSPRVDSPRSPRPMGSMAIFLGS